MIKILTWKLKIIKIKETTLKFKRIKNKKILMLIGKLMITK